MAEGEFALATQALELALTSRTEWIGDHDFDAMLADAAALQHDEIALRRYAPLLEELALRYGHLLYQAIAHRAGGWRIGWPANILPPSSGCNKPWIFSTAWGHAGNSVARISRASWQPPERML